MIQTLYHSDGVLWRIRKKKRSGRCITVRRTVTYEKEEMTRTLFHSDGVLWRIRNKKRRGRCIKVTAYCDISKGRNDEDFVSKWRCTMTYQTEERPRRCIIVTAYCDVSARRNDADVVSKWRCTVTYQTEETTRTLYQSDGVLSCIREKNRRHICINVTAYCDVSDRKNDPDVVSKWRCTMTYQTEETTPTLHHSDGVLWRIRKKKRRGRCIIVTAYCDVSAWRNDEDVVS